MKKFEEADLQVLLADKRYPKLKRDAELRLATALLYLWAPKGMTTDLAVRMTLTNHAKLLVSVGLWRRVHDGYVHADAIAPDWASKEELDRAPAPVPVRETIVEEDEPEEVDDDLAEPDPFEDDDDDE